MTKTFREWFDMISDKLAKAIAREGYTPNFVWNNAVEQKGKDWVDSEQISKDEFVDFITRQTGLPYSYRNRINRWFGNLGQSHKINSSTENWNGTPVVFKATTRNGKFTVLVTDDGDKYGGKDRYAIKDDYGVDYSDDINGILANLVFQSAWKEGTYDKVLIDDLGIADEYLSICRQIRDKYNWLEKEPKGSKERQFYFEIGRYFNHALKRGTPADQIFADVDNALAKQGINSSRKISSSQKGMENVAEGTQYDDYHIDTTGMGILDVEHIINEIEGRGNQAVLTVKTSDGATQHTQFNAKDWKAYKDAVNGVDEFSRDSRTKGAAITDVWVTEVEGGSYVRNSRKITSTRVNELTEQEKDDLYEIEKNEAEDYYNSLDDSDKQMLRVRYGIKNVKDYVRFFIVHPNKLSDDYEFINDPRTKLNSRQIKSARYIATDPESGEVLGSADTYEEAVNEWGEDVTITDSEATEGEETMESELFQSRKITSAVDGGWEVRSSDVPEALDLFVEYFGEEDALEEIAKAMGDNVLEENIDWIAQQWGFAEEIEDKDVWDKYETAKELMGESELFNNLTQAAGYDELAADLAFIFRMNDFREWDKYDNEDEDEEYEDLESENPELYKQLEDAKNRKVDWGEVAKNMYRDAGWSDKDIDKITNSNSFPIKTVKNIMSGKWSEDYAAECIAQKQDVNVGYAKQILSSWIEQYKPKLIKSGILDIAEDINTEFDIDGDLESWAEQYTNREGKSNTVGGEMVRAANQIIYRYNNDGDMIGRGYGNETVNAAARYIIEKAEMGVNEQIQKWLDHEERADDSEYDSFIETFTTEIEQILRENPELFQKPNKDDYWDRKEDEDMNYGLDECYLDDGLGNQYWFQLDAGDRWYCTGVELDPYHIAYSEGDYISDGDDYVDEIDRTEEFGSFEADGFIYEYAGDEMDDDTGEYTSWQITKVTSTDPFCDEGDTFDFYDLEPDELAGFRLFDHNGNEIDERTFLASSLIKSNITSGEEVVIEIERHGKWEIVAQSDDERGWTLKGDAIPAIFDNKVEAKSSQLAKDLERDGYSPNQGNMRFKKYS